MSATVDTVLSEIGGYGRYQIFLLQLVGFIEFGLSEFNVMIITFIAGEPTWECAESSVTCNFSGTIDTTSSNYNKRCEMPRSEWKFSDTFTSTVTEFELVCSKSFLQNVSSSLFWLGWLMGNLLFGHISDKVGRRKAIISSVIACSIFSWAIVWPRYLAVYIACRILIGIACAGSSMTSFVLLVEYSGVKHRSWAGSNIWYYGSACFMFLSLMAYLIREWRDLLLYGACLTIPVIVTSWFLPESCRYLLVNKRHDEAIKQLKKVAKWNRKTFQEVELERPFYDRKISMITIASWISWFCCALVYYAVTYGSIYLGGNIYLNFALVSLASIPSTFTSIICMNKFGRRKSLIYGMIISSIASIIAVAIPTDRSNTGYTIGRIIMAMICKYAILVSFNTVYIYSSELFPTSVRTIGIGTSSAFARIGSFLSLYVVWLIRIHALLPYSIVAVLCAVTGAICFKLLPETVNKPTPESMRNFVEMNLKNGDLVNGKDEENNSKV
ncbi:solute carrier family 22 member 16-like [Xenia sp. Carnegie-2017]|uniref:solute carrier family 22 member 16-like n=1 Tax=Xenia sp. Carnegie-2017 TaxID=2897299 RepID=UPI001F043182|nr:solute carrier family 22 member 16-like [Xenia sp. Carnegie-2017]